MSWKQLAGKGTWLGTATAAVVLLAALGVSSLLLLRGIVPERAMGPLVWVGSALACFCGGRMAIRQGGLLAGLIGTKQKRRRPHSGHRKSGDRRKRAVT